MISSILCLLGFHSWVLESIRLKDGTYKLEKFKCTDCYKRRVVLTTQDTTRVVNDVYKWY